MTDPEAAKENEESEVPPPQPPRPAPGAGLSQLESDEQYARQLAEHYERSGTYGGLREPRPYARTRDPGPGETSLKPNELYDREHSFIDDDLPVIRDNLRKGFHETQTKVNSWITNFKKRIDDAMEEDEDAQQQNLAYGRRPGEPSSRRSGDYERYDADPQVITDDFAGMKLAADGSTLFPSPCPPFPPSLAPQRFVVLYVPETNGYLTQLRSAMADPPRTRTSSARPRPPSPPAPTMGGAWPSRRRRRILTRTARRPSSERSGRRRRPGTSRASGSRCRRSTPTPLRTTTRLVLGTARMRET